MSDLRIKRIVALAMAMVMAISTPIISFAEVTEVSNEIIVENVADENLASYSENEEAMIDQIASSSEGEADETLTATSSEDIYLEAVADDGMKVTLKAEKEAFEFYEGLSLEVLTVSEKVAKEADKELQQETKDDNIAKRVTYDVRVMHDGEEIQPIDGATVDVEFIMSEIPSGADAVSVYHHNEETNEIEIIDNDVPVNVANEGESLSVSEGINADANTAEHIEYDEDDIYIDDEIIDDVTVGGKTRSFSLYTVDFTYEEKTVCITGDTTKNLLSDILADVGIEGEIAEAKAYQDESCSELAENGEVKDGDKVLFRVYDEDGEWYVDAVNAFSTKHGIVVKIADGAEYEIKVTDDVVTENLLTFTSEQAGSSITFCYASGEMLSTVDNGVSWDDCPSGTVIELLSVGSKVSVKAKNLGTTEEKPISTNGSYHFSINGRIAASGSVMSLRSSLSESCFKQMFYGCSGLTCAPELPAKTLSKGCYSNMFTSCTALATPPELSAMDIAVSCYESMFLNCTGLIELPELPATKLEADCYNWMFNGCSSIKVYKTPAVEGYRKEFRIPAGAVAQTGWNNNMFHNTSGDFTGDPEIGRIYFANGKGRMVAICWDAGAGKFRDGSKSMTSQVEYGTTPIAPSSPSREATAEYTYIFAGWSETIVPVTESKIYIAQYTPIAKGGGGGSSVDIVRTFSRFWKLGDDGYWRIYNDGQMVTKAWLCDDAVSSNGKNVWYLLNSDGTMLDAGLVQDSRGNFYSLETNHDGYYGMLRYKNGYYNCNGQQVYLEFEQSHNGSFAAIKNADGLAKLKQIYGITRFPVDNSFCQYTQNFK